MRFNGVGQLFCLSGGLSVDIVMEGGGEAPSFMQVSRVADRGV